MSRSLKKTKLILGFRPFFRNFVRNEGIGKGLLFNESNGKNKESAHLYRGRVTLGRSGHLAEFLDFYPPGRSVTPKAANAILPPNSPLR